LRTLPHEDSRRVVRFVWTPISYSLLNYFFFDLPVGPHEVGCHEKNEGLLFKVGIGGEKELVEAEAIFPHGELNRVFPCYRNIQPDLAGLAAVVGGCALFAGPGPLVFPFAPLHALSTRGPCAVEPNVDAIVFRAR